MDPTQLIIAFTAGTLAFLSPCSFPMLPVYVSYYLNKSDQKGSLVSGLTLAFSMVAGFLLVFAVIGVIFSFILSELTKWIWVTDPLIGAVLIILGLSNWRGILNGIPRISLSADGNKLSFLAYGVIYGVSSLGCSLPIFILVVLQGATAKDLSEMLVLFAAYGTGSAAIIIPLTLTLTLMKGLFHERLLILLPNMSKINSLVMIIAGAYMMFKGLIR